AMIKQSQGAVLELAARCRGPMIEVVVREASRAIPIEALPAAPSLEPAESPAVILEPADELQGVECLLARRLGLLHGGALITGRDAEGALTASFMLPAARDSA